MIRVAIGHDFPGFTLDIAFDAPARGVTALFGPSGAGKSSVIAALAGLFHPSRAALEVDGVVWASDSVWLGPERRRVGLVFQDSRLFPHMSVATNLRYGLRRAPLGPITFDDVVRLLGIGGLLGRRPRFLSGGEKQRVAIGRALLAQPRLLLMDEPLASLDTARRGEILPYLARLATFGVPIIYVSHALDEVVRLADTLVVIEAGRVRATGPLGVLTARGDIGILQGESAGAVLDGVIIGHDPARRLSLVAVGEATVVIALIDRPAHAPIRLRVPANEVALATETPAAISLQNAIDGRVRAMIADTDASTVLIEVAFAGGALVSRVTADAVARLDLAVGRPVIALFKSVSVQTLV